MNSKIKTHLMAKIIAQDVATCPNFNINSMTFDKKLAKEVCRREKKQLTNKNCMQLKTIWNENINKIKEEVNALLNTTKNVNNSIEEIKEQVKIQTLRNEDEKRHKISLIETGNRNGQNEEKMEETNDEERGDVKNQDEEKNDKKIEEKIQIRKYKLKRKRKIKNQNAIKKINCRVRKMEEEEKEMQQEKLNVHNDDKETQRIEDFKEIEKCDEVSLAEIRKGNGQKEETNYEERSNANNQDEGKNYKKIEDKKQIRKSKPKRKRKMHNKNAVEKINSKVRKIEEEEKEVQQEKINVENDDKETKRNEDYKEIEKCDEVSLAEIGKGNGQEEETNYEERGNVSNQDEVKNDKKIGNKKKIRKSKPKRRRKMKNQNAVEKINCRVRKIEEEEKEMQQEKISVENDDKETKCIKNYKEIEKCDEVILTEIAERNGQNEEKSDVRKNDKNVEEDNIKKYKKKRERIIPNDIEEMEINYDCRSIYEETDKEEGQETEKNELRKFNVKNENTQTIKTEENDNIKKRKRNQYMKDEEKKEPRQNKKKEEYEIEMEIERNDKRNKRNKQSKMKTEEKKEIKDNTENKTEMEETVFLKKIQERQEIKDNKNTKSNYKFSRENYSDSNSDENLDEEEDYYYSKESDDSSTTNDSTLSESFPNHTDVERPHVSNQLKAKYCEYRGEILLPFNLDILKPGTQDIDAENLRLLIRDSLPESLNIKCRLTFGTLRKNRENHVQYASCRNVDCRQKFKFDIVIEYPMITSIFVSSTDYSDETHDNKLYEYYQLRGKERLKLKQELININPRLYQTKIIESIDPDIARSGNMQQVRSLYVYQKARSEEMSKYDRPLKSLELQDLNQQWIDDYKTNDPYLRSIGLPVRVIMYNEEKLRVIGPGKILRADATGNCCGQSTFMEAKRVLYYAYVVYVCGVVLRKCYECVVNGASFPKEWTIVHNCAVHFLKRVSDKLKEEEPSFIGKSLIMDLMAFMVQCKTVAELDSVFRQLITILVCNDENEAENARAKLSTMCFEGFEAVSKFKEEKNHEDEKTDEKIEEKEDKENERQNLQDEILKEKGNEVPIYKDSPFHDRYSNILDELKNKLLTPLTNDKGEKNQFQSLKLASYIVDHYMPFVPMWSSIIISEKNPKISHLHNQHVEAHFHTVKHTVLKKKKDAPIGRVVRCLKQYTQSLTTTIRCGIQYKRGKNLKPEFTERKSIIPEHNDPTVQEEWRKGPNKRSKMKHTHFEGTFLKKNLSDYKTTLENDKKEKSRNKNLKIGKRKNCHIASKRRRKIRDPVKKERKYKQTNNQALKRKSIDVNVVNSKKQCTSEIRNVIEDERCERTWSNASTSILNQSDSSFHVKAMENGLFDDYKYYTEDIENDLTVGRFSAETEVPFSHDVNLYQSMFKTLNVDVTNNRNKWIDTYVIDAFALTQIETWKNASYINLVESTFMFGNYADEFYKTLLKEKGLKNIRKIRSGSIFYTEYEFKNIVLIPFLTHNHYQLVMLNIADECITLFDPITKRSSNKQVKNIIMMLKRLTKVCGEGTILNNLENKKWKVRSYNQLRPLQKDSFNCGVFVMYYMYCLGNDIQMNENIDINEYRITIARILLSKSKNMKDTCLYCFSEKRDGFVMCKYCRRYAHISCIPGPRKSIEEWSRPETEFKCTYCEREVREWM